MMNKTTMRRAALGTMILTVLVLTGCAKEGETIHDVDYYQGNGHARAAKLKECRDNPGQMSVNANCMNAAKADKKEQSSNTGTVRVRTDNIKM